MCEIKSHSTVSSAPDGTPNTRRLIGVGETVDFVADRSARWSGVGVMGIPSGTDRRVSLIFNQPGDVTVTARAGAREDSRVFRVVEPSMSLRRVQSIKTFPEDHHPNREQVGVGMRLQFTLTPFGVSFNQMLFREESGPADQVWGYFRNFFSRRPTLSRHRAITRWAMVGPNNDLNVQDIARFAMSPRNMDWPIVAGGFRWNIHDSYRVGSLEKRLPRRMPQSFRIVPEGPQTSLFTGTLSVNKGGVTTTSHYVNNRLVIVR